MPKSVNTTNINQAVESSYYTHENFPRFPFLIFFLFKTDFLFVKWSVKKGLTSTLPMEIQYHTVNHQSRYRKLSAVNDQ